ncbi:MAG TPA: RtcB family protein [Polyangiaceae bacterium]|nr:RtcB family protein [Polyangiaceae bacterium]
MLTFETKNAKILAWVEGVPFEDAARKQVENVASLPFVHEHVAIMPDVHWGMGATVGSVIATRGAIIPAAVGVDIGCGMIAARTNLVASDLPDSLSALRSAIEAAVPHGRTHQGGPNDRGAWGQVGPVVEAAWSREDPGAAASLAARFRKLADKHPKIAAANHVRHLGTLGTGNHFIELCVDEAQGVWVMLHSGSRGVGNRIGSYFIELAKEDMRLWFINLPDQDLAYLTEGTRHFDDYLEAVGWAQDFALKNRALMLRATLRAVAETLGREVTLSEEAVQCHHNYVNRERHFDADVLVTRKGAVSAREGELGIIPGSMGARSYIVSGKGNPESFQSCSHGAGRAMSRAEAKRRFTLEDHAQAVAGVECRRDADVLDETPGAYKDVEAVMAAQRDLVAVVHTLKQVLCVKG